MKDFRLPLKKGLENSKSSTYNASTPSPLSVLVQHHVAGFRVIDSPVVFHLDHALLQFDPPQGALAGPVVHQLALGRHPGPLVHVIGLETRRQGQRPHLRGLPAPQQRLHLRRFVTFVTFYLFYSRSAITARRLLQSRISKNAMTNKFDQFIPFLILFQSVAQLISIFFYVCSVDLLLLFSRYN